MVRSGLGLGDTIAAIATPLGVGGIGIVRLSGRDSLAILESLFRPVSTSPSAHPRSLCLGHIVDPIARDKVDEVLVSYMPAPHTYTREPVVEINAHGGGLVLRQVLRLCLSQGARQAEPGEFTLRAFINGRIDLTQAEAVRDLVSARTEGAQRQALAQLGGGLGARVHQCHEGLQRALMLAEAAIDLDEAVERDVIEEELAPAIALLEELTASVRRGRLCREGLRVAIVGSPNVGKSSLLNALLRSDRAIVTDIPGTTRDTLEEAVDLGGMAVTFVDTAGLRDDPRDDPVERLGQERSRRALDSADLALLVLDASRPLSAADRAAAAEAERSPLMLTVWNKIDLSPPKESRPAGPPEVAVSALTGQGLEDLEQLVVELALGAEGDGDEAPLTSERHAVAAQRALGAALAAREALEEGHPLDLIAQDLRDAGHHLGEITGKTVDRDSLLRLFGTFCVGK